MNEDLADALETLHRDAFGWSLHCCGGDASKAEDVLQTAYLKVAQGRARYSGASSLKTWWFGVIRYTACETSRRIRSQELLSLRFFWHGQALAPGSVSPARRLELDEEATRLRAAMEKLPARQAEVLHLVFYQDLTLSSVAQILGISIGSVRQHYERGKARLRELLSGHERS